MIPCAAVASIGLVVPLAASATVTTQPTFYTAPANIADDALGQVIASRTASAWDFGGPSAVSAWQISFRTNDAHNKAELGITTLVVPKTAWKGGGARPVVSIESAEDSDGTTCAPSYEIESNSDLTDPAEAGSLLLLGYAVAIPDDEGPESTFLAGPQEGHAVLDGIRAVENFDHAGIGKANKWALDGYSGGANSVGWAAQLQPSYAPEIPLVGAAMGGTPANPVPIAESLDGGVASGLEFAAAEGIATEWPESGIEQLLNAKGIAAFSEIKGQCAEEVVPEFAFQKLSSYTKVPDPLNVPSVVAVLKLDTLGATAPTTPIYDYHGLEDEIVPLQQDNTLVSTWCHEGATVDEVRDPGEHLSEVVVRYLSVQQWLTARFEGQKAPDTC
jgi:hypothetical protein